MSELKHEEWAGNTFGNNTLHRWLIGSLRLLNVRMLYIFSALFVVPPTMIINARARKAIYRFYRQLGYGWWRSQWLTYKNHCAFSTVVVDRFAMYAGEKFKIDIEGYELFQELSEGEKGFVQLSSHIGNYEIAGYSLVAKDKRFNALVFGGEKESVMVNRNRMFDGNNIRMISMADDMSHLFLIDQALAQGEILSIAADRVFGSQKQFKLNFFGKTAVFPQGPFIIAALRDLPMLFVTVMKAGAKRYKINVQRIDCAVKGSTRVKALNLAKQYVGLLEEAVRKNPAQWYNYFEFWTNDESE